MMRRNSAQFTYISVSAGMNLTFNATNWNVGQMVVLNAAEDEDTTDDHAAFTIASAGLSTQTVNATELDNDLQKLTRCVGETATFSTTPSGPGPFSYLWRKAGLSLDGQTNNSLVLTNVMAGDAGTYSVEVSSGSYTVTKIGMLAVNTSTSVVGPSNQTQSGHHGDLQHRGFRDRSVQLSMEEGRRAVSRPDQ